MEQHNAFGLSSRVPVDGTLVTLLLPSCIASAMIIPSGLFTSFGTLGGLEKVVASGCTANFYWLSLTCVPIVTTLAFTTSMVWAARVVATTWEKNRINQTGSLDGVGSSENPKSRQSSARWLRRSSTIRSSTGSSARLHESASTASKVLEASAKVKRISPLDAV